MCSPLLKRGNPSFEKFKKGEELEKKLGVGEIKPKGKEEDFQNEREEPNF